MRDFAKELLELYAPMDKYEKTCGVGFNAVKMWEAVTTPNEPDISICQQCASTIQEGSELCPTCEELWPNSK